MTQQLNGQTTDQTDPMKAMVVLVRAALRDWAPINELLEKEESRDRDIVLAIIRCLEDFNGTPPVTGYSLEGLLSFHQFDLLLQGSMCNVVHSVYFPYMRNEVQYSDAGTSINIQGKHKELLRWYQLTKNEYEQKKRAAKNHLNQEGLLNAGGGMSGVPSEFWYLYNTVED